MKFICAVCHLEYRSDPKFTDEHRRAEYEEVHGKPFPGTEDVGRVCDTCYAEVVAWAQEKGLLP